MIYEKHQAVQFKICGKSVRDSSPRAFAEGRMRRTPRAPSACALTGSECETWSSIAVRLGKGGGVGGRRGIDFAGLPTGRGADRVDGEGYFLNKPAQDNNLIEIACYAFIMGLYSVIPNLGHRERFEPGRHCLPDLPAIAFRMSKGWKGGRGAHGAIACVDGRTRPSSVLRSKGRSGW